MEGSTLGSSITIGNGVSIRPGSTIESYVVLGDCVMVAEFATIGAGSIVGNCASVAAGTKINWGGVGIPGEPGTDHVSSFPPNARERNTTEFCLPPVMGPELPSILEDA